MLLIGCYTLFVDTTCVCLPLPIVNAMNKKPEDSVCRERKIVCKKSQTRREDHCILITKRFSQLQSSPIQNVVCYVVLYMDVVVNYENVHLNVVVDY